MLRLAALWPAALFLLATGFTGGFVSGAGFPALWIGLGAVLATAVAGIAEIADPLRLGAGRGLLWALLAVVGASVYASEVPRAGLVGCILLLAFLGLPAAIARQLRTSSARRAAVGAWGVVTAVIAAWALVEATTREGARAAAPLGHHNLLAVCLAMALPVAALGWREGGVGRVVAALSATLGIAAIVASRSLTGAVAVGAAAWVGARRAGRARDLLLGLTLLGIGLAVPRVESIVRGRDASASARAVYLEAAWNGALERPWLGWGPGSAPWVLAGFLAPRPGVNPPGELVGDPHSTPLALAFELGLPATVLALGFAAALAWRRRHLDAAVDPGLAAAGLAGLAAGGVALLGGAWWAVPAVPTTLALVGGFAFAGEGSGRAPSRPVRLVGAAYGVAAVVLLAPVVRAHGLYETASTEADPALRRERLASAVRIDGEFPLYRARLGWGSGDPSTSSDLGDWRQLRKAAAQARGVAPLWLRTAAVAAASGQRSAAVHAALQAMAFDPLSGTAPFLLHLAEPRDVDCAARAMLAEPKIAAATAWRDREIARRAALARVVRWEGVDDAWKREFVAQALAAPPRGENEVDLVTRIDGAPALAASLYEFRRSPWPAEVARIRLDREAADRISVPRATELRSSSHRAFPRRACAPGSGRGRGGTGSN